MGNIAAPTSDVPLALVDGPLIDGKIVAGRMRRISRLPRIANRTSNMEHELKRLTHKVECKAQYIVTQMFFDNSDCYRFFDSCGRAGSTVPIILGPKSIGSRHGLATISLTFHVVMLSASVELLGRVKTQDEIRETGIQWCIE